MKKDAVLDSSQKLKDQMDECQKQINTLELAQKNKLAIRGPAKEEEKKQGGFLADLDTFAVEDI
jgi:hypothetical protein